MPVSQLSYGIHSLDASVILSDLGLTALCSRSTAVSLDLLFEVLDDFVQVGSGVSTGAGAVSVPVLEDSHFSGSLRSVLGAEFAGFHGGLVVFHILIVLHPACSGPYYVPLPQLSHWLFV